MTSNDNSIVIREDVFTARMDALMSEIRLENEKLRNELTTKIDKVEGSLSARIDGVDSSLNAKIEGVQSSLNAKIDRVDASLRSEMKDIQVSLRGEIRDVQASLRSEMRDMGASLTAKIDGYQAQNEKQFSEVRAEIKVLSTRMDGLDSRMGDMQNTISWSFTLATVFIAVMGMVISVFIAFAPSIWRYVRRKPKPELSREDVRTMVADEVKQALESFFAGHPSLQGK